MIESNDQAAKSTSGTGPGTGDTQKSVKSGATFTRVTDSRGRPIPALWQRRGRFYARVTIAGRDRRQSLEAVTVRDAKIELRKLQVLHQDNPSPANRQVPTVAEFKTTYLQHAALTKRPRTAELEKIHLKHFTAAYDKLRLNEVTKDKLLRFRADRLAGGWSKRTANLAMTIIRNLLKHAVDVGALAEIPFDPIPSLKHVPKRKRLYEWTEIEHLCRIAERETRNGAALADYIRLLAFCGARRNEALRLRWEDVDFERGLLVIGADGLAKNHLSRTVDLNTKLAAHLRDMRGRRNHSSPWLFPGADPAKHLRTFKEAIRVARNKAGDTEFGFHHCRVFFASQCVMAGIDFRTIAAWLGHQDGGVLLSRVYARLSDEHKRRAAARLEIG